MKFEKIATKEQFEQWKEFAATFDHASERPHLPLVVVSDDDGQPFAYWSTLAFPIVMPAFHPDKTSPRQFKEVTETVSNAHIIASLGALQHSNGACYLALEESPAVDKELIQKMGFEELGLSLWRKA